RSFPAGFSWNGAGLPRRYPAMHSTPRAEVYLTTVPAWMKGSVFRITAATTAGAGRPRLPGRAHPVPPLRLRQAQPGLQGREVQGVEDVLRLQPGAPGDRHPEGDLRQLARGVGI